MAKHSIDSKRLKQLIALSKDKGKKFTPKLLQELSVLKAKQDILKLDLSEGALLRIKNHLEGLEELGRLTKADKARLNIVNKILEQ